MAVTCLDPLQQFFDDDGNPLNGGFVYSYNAVTDAPLAIYTETGGTIAHENPIELDSAGRPPAPLFYIQGEAYNLVLQTSEAVEVQANISFEVPDLSATDPVNYYEVEFYRDSTPSESARIYGLSLRRDVTFAANWNGSGGVVPETPPGSDCIITVKINGSEVGTATCSTLGVWTFATSGGGAVDGFTDDELTFHAPADATTISDIGLTLVGTLA